MTQCYDITLDSPMGPRSGTLLLTLEGSCVTGMLSLLGYDNPVRGTLHDGRLFLHHRLHSALRELSCNCVLELASGTLSGTLETAWGSMRCKGTLQQELSEPTHRDGQSQGGLMR